MHIYTKDKGGAKTGVTMSVELPYTVADFTAEVQDKFKQGVCVCERERERERESECE